ncbi:unnamed protein product [Adineta ricciae]|uniref:G-protein coupled receptors family 1 profile domain-containing protein n=1 Tax=Adineta ricciae TaxID=249248 RepID=A0A815ASU7_ADIRI|nr:unnamed protein product [Adineta ricciae]CAF1261471.1 unnamed protein product [Adineta ricciae]
MSNANTSESVNLSSTASSSFISRNFKFWSYLIFLVPSILCSLFVLYHLLFDRTLRRSLNNHVIILLLFTVLLCEVSNYPWMLYYYAHNNVWQRSFVFCSIWGFFDWAIYILQLMLFAWASIERHILIFHDKWVSTDRKRFYVHYLPVIVILIYWLIFYSVVYFFPPCRNVQNNGSMVCITACIFNNFPFRAFETFFNNIIPSLIIVFASAALLWRVLRQRYRVRQQIQWRKHRKMTVQLLWISALYLLITAPLAIIIFLGLCGLLANIGTAFGTLAIYASYYIVLLFPFVSLLSLPELYIKLKKMLHLQRRIERRRNNQVTPK